MRPCQTIFGRGLEGITCFKFLCVRLRTRNVYNLLPNNCSNFTFQWLSRRDDCIDELGRFWRFIKDVVLRASCNEDYVRWNGPLFVRGVGSLFAAGDFL